MFKYLYDRYYAFLHICNGSLCLPVGPFAHLFQKIQSLGVSPKDLYFVHMLVTFSCSIDLDQICWDDCLGIVDSAALFLSQNFFHKST